VRRRSAEQREREGLFFLSKDGMKEGQEKQPTFFRGCETRVFSFSFFGCGLPFREVWRLSPGGARTESSTIKKRLTPSVVALADGRREGASRPIVVVFFLPSFLSPARLIYSLIYSRVESCATPASRLVPCVAQGEAGGSHTARNLHRKPSLSHEWGREKMCEFFSMLPLFFCEKTDDELSSETKFRHRWEKGFWTSWRLE
jgi:hypothetical protein